MRTLSISLSNGNVPSKTKDTMQNTIAPIIATRAYRCFIAQLTVLVILTSSHSSSWKSLTSTLELFIMHTELWLTLSGTSTQSVRFSNEAFAGCE